MAVGFWLLLVCDSSALPFGKIQTWAEKQHVTKQPEGTCGNMQTNSQRERSPWCGHAGGIPLCCSLSFSFSRYFVLFLASSPPTLALTDKEKTQDNLLGKSYLEVAWESLNTWCAENHAGKIQVYYCIHYFTSVKVATSSLSEERKELASPWQPFTCTFCQC